MEHEAGGTGGANQPSHIDNDDILLHSLLEVFHHFDMIPNRM